jgi:hypothetical protein
LDLKTYDKHIIYNPNINPNLQVLGLFFLKKTTSELALEKKLKS